MGKIFFKDNFFAKLFIYNKLAELIIKNQIFPYNFI